MKISEIKKLVLEANQCVIATSMRGKQYVGTPYALYPVDDGLTLTEENVAGLFDLDEKQRKNVVVSERPLEVCGCWPLLNVTMNAMASSSFTIKGVEDYILLSESGKTFCLPTRVIRPAVGKTEYRQYMLGKAKYGNPVIVIEDGMMWAGIALPMDVGRVENIQRELRAFAFGPAGGVGKTETDLEPEDAMDEDEQLSMEGGNQ
jgi:hypothetical protein